MHDQRPLSVCAAMLDVCVDSSPSTSQLLHAGHPCSAARQQAVSWPNASCSLPHLHSMHSVPTLIDTGSSPLARAATCKGSLQSGPTQLRRRSGADSAARAQHIASFSGLHDHLVLNSFCPIVCEPESEPHWTHINLLPTAAALDMAGKRGAAHSLLSSSERLWLVHKQLASMHSYRSSRRAAL